MADFFEILNYDTGITDIMCMPQHFKNNESYTYTSQNPRSFDGLLIILCPTCIYYDNDSFLFTAGRGDIIYMPRGSHYKIQFVNPENLPVSSILINFKFITESGIDFSSQHPQIIIKNGDAFISDFSNAVQLYVSQKEKSLKIKSYIFSLMAKLAEYNAASRGIIEKTIWYIENNLDKALKISELAKLSAKSETQFRADFKAHTGISPNSFILNLKIEKACQLLSGGEVSIPSISESLGFYDNAHFYRLFKKRTGMTPLDYKLNNSQK